VRKWFSLLAAAAMLCGSALLAQEEAKPKTVSLVVEGVV
jgi:hypothetical protein